MKNKIQKIIASILLAFVTLVACSPVTYAVSFNGNKEPNFPGVQGVGEFFGENIDNKPFWSTNQEERINNITSIVCLTKDGKGCVTYLVNVTQFFVIDLQNEFNQYVNDSIGSIQATSYKYNVPSIHFFVGNFNTKGEKDEDNIYLNYRFGDNTGNLVKISKDQKCGTENPNICVIGLNTFLTYSAVGTTRGVYWTYSDVTVYSDENDNIKIHRSHRDKKEGNGVGLFQSLIQNIAGYSGGYGARIGDLREGELIFSSYKENGKGMFITLDVENGYGYFKTEEVDDSLNANYKIPITYGHATIGQQDYEVYKKSNVLIPLMNEYLWGENSATGSGGTTNILYTLQDVFKFKLANSSENTDASAHPDNHTGCETTDVGCHIKNLTAGIGKAIGSIWDGFWSGWGKLFDLLGKIIKDFFMSFVNFANDVIGYIEGDPNKQKEESFLNDLVKGTIIKWDLVFGTNQKLICDAKFNYSFTESEKNYIAEEYRKYVPDDAFIYTLFGLFNFMNPIPPSNGETICTYTGIQQVHYRENSWVDIILLMLFCGMTLTLFYRNYN